MSLIKNLANLITATRFVCAGILLFTVPCSLPFWILYGYGGASDLADGLVARTMKRESDVGAKLDSVADTVFFFAIVIAVIQVIVIPPWIFICAIAIAIIRVTTYLIGYKKYCVFSALHTYANKITGGVLFCTPVLYMVIGITGTGIILCLLAGLSACEELLITLRSKDLDRNRKSIFVH